MECKKEIEKTSFIEIVHTKSLLFTQWFYIHLCAKFWLGHNKTITKTTQLSIITLAKANLNMSCFLVKIYSLPIQLQFLDQKINN